MLYCLGRRTKSCASMHSSDREGASWDFATTNVGAKESDSFSAVSAGARTRPGWRSPAPRQVDSLMSQLLPGRQTACPRAVLLDYCTTTFVLDDPDPQAALRELLEGARRGCSRDLPAHRMPFSPAPRRAVSPLDWMPVGFDPYAHEATAFRRFSSLNGRPQPTLVTTGTGPGKTEAFL